MSWRLIDAGCAMSTLASIPQHQRIALNTHQQNMERSNLWRWIYVCLAVGSWAFLLLAIGSFDPTDWPSHAVHPYPPVQNLCGPVGAFIAYYLFLIVGQGAFPILFFSGVCVVLFVSQARVSDPWMRVIGLLLGSVAFAAAIHHFHPGSENGLPEGQGGILGIGAATYLQHHLSAAGTTLVLLVAMLIGLLLAADDLVLKSPAFFMLAFEHARTFKNTFETNLPAFKRTTETNKTTTTKAPVARLVKPDEDPDELRSPMLLKPFKKWFTRSIGDDVELDYPNDEPAAAVDQGVIDQNDPGPAVPMDHAPQPPAAPTPPPIKINNVASAPLATIATVATPVTLATTTATPSETTETDIVGPVAGIDVTHNVTEPAVQRAEIVVKLPNAVKPRQVSPPPPPPKELGEYHLPNWDCLANAEHGYVESQEAFVREKAAVLEQALKEFNVDAHVVEIDTGPVITMYELSLAPGLKVSTITSLTNDIMRALKAESVRIVAPVPGKNTVGIEVPNEQKEKVRFKELLQLAPDALAKDF